MNIRTRHQATSNLSAVESIILIKKKIDGEKHIFLGNKPNHWQLNWKYSSVHFHLLCRAHNVPFLITKIQQIKCQAQANRATTIDWNAYGEPHCGVASSFWYRLTDMHFDCHRRRQINQVWLLESYQKKIILNDKKKMILLHYNIGAFLI